MSKFAVIFIALLPFDASSALAAAEPAALIALGQSVDAAVAEGRLPSTVVVLFDEHRVLWSHMAGHADLGKKAPTMRTRYRLGSMAKAVTSTVLAIAEERGLIRFDDKVRVETTEGKRIVSLRELVNMQAGLAQAVCYDGINGIAETDCRRSFSGRFVVSIANGKDRYSYSNMGPQLAADALAEQLDLPFETIARRMLFVPAGMNEATFDHQRPTPSKATSFDQTGKPYEHDFRIVPAAGAGFEASAKDLVRFGQLHLTGQNKDGRQLLTPRMLRELHSAPNDGFYGYGWGRVGADSATDLLISDGQVNGGQAMLLINRVRKVGAVVISNAANNEVSELAFKAIDTIAPGTVAAFSAAVGAAQAAHEAKVSRFLPPQDFSGAGLIRADAKRLPIKIIVRQNRLAATVAGAAFEQVLSETAEGFRGWEVSCPDQIAACAQPGAKAKLWLTADADGLAGQFQVTNTIGQVPFPVRIRFTDGTP